MQKSKIEWTDYTINPIKGKCPMACSYCYARRMYKRFKWNPRLRYDAAAWLGLGSLKKPSRIFVGSTIELFHCRMNPKWLKWIFEVPLEFPQHTFIFLTKQPGNLIKWSPFPDNCWVGVTATSMSMLFDAVNCLYGIKASVKYVSIEPFLSWGDTSKFVYPLESSLKEFNWIIIGAQTHPLLKPRVEWVKELTEVAIREGVAVFHKNNLKETAISSMLLTDKEFEKLYGVPFRQEMPNE